MSTVVSLVLARAANGVIGHDGGLPWRLSRDLKRFREITMGKPIIMGRKTHESIGRPLPGRENIIVSRDPDYSSPGCHVVAGLDAALALGRRIAGDSETGEVCVVGGGEIYRAGLADAERIYLTEIEMNAEGDVSLEPFDPGTWREVERVRFEPEGDDSAAFSFVVLERRVDPGPSPDPNPGPIPAIDPAA